MSRWPVATRLVVSNPGIHRRGARSSGQSAAHHPAVPADLGVHRADRRHRFRSDAPTRRAESVTSTTVARPLPVGRIVLGLLVVTAGSAWLLDSLDVIEVSWTIFFPVALIITGIGVIAASPGTPKAGSSGWGSSSRC